MAAGRRTILAFAGIISKWEESTHIQNSIAELKFKDDFNDTVYDRERRQRILDRIRAEERAAGIDHPSSDEDKYDRWALTNEMV